MPGTTSTRVSWSLECVELKYVELEECVELEELESSTLHVPWFWWVMMSSC